MQRHHNGRKHSYSLEVFSLLNIIDLQGLLMENETIKCGIEVYQVVNLKSINFELLNQKDECARFKLCNQLGVPYYVIITSKETGCYQIYGTDLTNNTVSFTLQFSYTKLQFLNWWSSNQGVIQKKLLTNASTKKSEFIIDNDLISNSLTWGVDIDGFIIDEKTDKILSFFEKRICNYNPPYMLDTFDPNKIFFASVTRSGEFASWNSFFNISKNLKVPLILFTFDTSNNRKLGLTRIIGISQQNGISYANNLKPFNNLINDNLSKVKNWLINEI